MKKNEVLSMFLKEKREKFFKNSKAAAEAIGVSPSQYYQWETMGCIPKDLKRREKITELFNITMDELLEKADITSENQQNIIPLLKEIANSNCPTMSMEDIEFLTRIQDDLDQPMSSVLIDELMKHRVSQDSDQ
ncbi:MAG: helix-turn-helix transcriptional regulator [bacterium]|nr:helix-turn-helix transcriptional regulator [bacterium]